MKFTGPGKNVFLSTFLHDAPAVKHRKDDANFPTARDKNIGDISITVAHSKFDSPLFFSRFLLLLMIDLIITVNIVETYKSHTHSTIHTIQLPPSSSLVWHGDNIFTVKIMLVDM